MRLECGVWCGARGSGCGGVGVAAGVVAHLSLLARGLALELQGEVVHNLGERLVDARVVVLLRDEPVKLVPHRTSLPVRGRELPVEACRLGTLPHRRELRIERRREQQALQLRDATLGPGGKERGGGVYVCV